MFIAKHMAQPLLWTVAAALLLGACASAPEVARAPERPAVVRRALAEVSPRSRRAAEPPPPTLTIAAGGDVIFGRYIRGELRRAGGPDPFGHIAERFARADLALLNLETPVTDFIPELRPNPYGKWLKFRAPTANIEHLAKAGIDVAVTANNHAEDCGPQGVADTISTLAARGIATVGTSVEGDPYAPLTLEVDGVRVAIVAATSKRNRGKPRPGQRVPVAFMTTDEMLRRLPKTVASLREAGEHDLIIVTIHWGAGFVRKVHFKQKRVARAVIDAGADLLLGHHAHILQAFEQYGDGLIVYGMGNLIFDMRDKRGRETALFEITLEPRGGRWRPERLEVRPLIIDAPDAPPRWASGAVAEEILEPVAQPTRARFDTVVEREGDVLIWERRRGR